MIIQLSLALLCYQLIQSTFFLLWYNFEQDMGVTHEGNSLVAIGLPFPSPNIIIGVGKNFFSLLHYGRGRPGYEAKGMNLTF